MINPLYIYSNNFSNETKYYTDKYQVVYDCIKDIIDNSVLTDTEKYHHIHHVIKGLGKKNYLCLYNYGFITEDEIIDNI